MKVSLFDLLLIYETEVKKNVRNKKKILYFEKHKMEYLVDIKNVLENNLYNGGRYNIFLVFEPKVRVIMAQGIYDKIINHYVTRYILIPKLEKYLNDRNCATRKGMGTSYAIKLLKKDIESFKKYDKFYFLKLDISKYFYSLDHEVIISIIKQDLNQDELNLVKIILDSTNKEYINKKIEYLEKKYNVILPKYEYKKGLAIGNLSSQFLAILYLSKLQHYITNNLHIRFINYMDDYIIIHNSKDYLKDSLELIENKINIEYKLKLNKKKTVISNSNQGISFLGYTFRVKDNKTIIKLSSNTKKNIRKGIKRANYLYRNNIIKFNQYFSSIECFKNNYIFVNKDKVKHFIDRYNG